MRVRRHAATRHHLNPRSRIKDLVKLLGARGISGAALKKIGATRSTDTMKHNCWHLLFSNYFAWEAIEQIKLWATDDLDDFRIHLNMETKMAWYILFGGNASPKEAIETIKKEWWPEYPTMDLVAKIGLVE